jgi:hypothetical protein
MRRLAGFFELMRLHFKVQPLFLRVVKYANSPYVNNFARVDEICRIDLRRLGCVTDAEVKRCGNAISLSKRCIRVQTNGLPG